MSTLMPHRQAGQHDGKCCAADRRGQEAGLTQSVTACASETGRHQGMDQPQMSTEDNNAAPRGLTLLASAPMGLKFHFCHTSIPRPSTTGLPGARGRGSRPRVVGDCHTADREMPSQKKWTRPVGMSRSRPVPLPIKRVAIGSARTGVPMNQLSDTLNFTTAGTTNVADRLASAGLLERRPAPADRRVTLAVLTDKGRQTATTAALILADTLQERVIAPLGTDALAKLADTVGSLAPGPRRIDC
jgi:DNA-binding MarR family transcriptional regulator